MIRVKLRGRDGSLRGVALLDDGDAGLAERRWHLDGNGYAATNVRLPGGGYRITQLHREVLGLTWGDGQQADHRNGCRLDCRRSNLRVVTAAQNAQNQLRRGRALPRGVYLHGVTGRYAAQVGRKHLGLFDTPDAASAVASSYRRAHLPYANEARARG